MKLKITNKDGDVLDDKAMNDLYDEAWRAVDPEVRQKAVEVLRLALGEDQLALIRDAVAEHGPHDWHAHEPFSANVVYDVDEETGEELTMNYPWHFGPGMAIRNLLRSAGLRDEVLPRHAMDAFYGQGAGIQNWDDYYIAAVEAAAGVRDV